MGRDVSRSRSPSYRRSSRRSRRDRSRSPYSSYSHSRRKSRSVTPRRRRSRSRSLRSRSTRSPTPRRYRRRKTDSTSRSPVEKSHSPSIGSVERKNAGEKLKQDEEERQRCKLEAELRLIEEETAKRVEAAIQKNVAERLESEEIKLEIRKCLENGRRKLQEEVALQLEKEREAAIIEARKKEEQARKEKEELERMLEENRKRIEEAQRMEALEQQRREEEWYRELEEMQRKKEEAMLRKKQQEEEEHAKQMVLLGKNKSRPKLSFAINSNSRKSQGDFCIPTKHKFQEVKCICLDVFCDS